ncbi:MAG: transcription antitermination factor NusB [Candidatus Kapabacteria bacterium]|nr:transcription antitermination factor NusB [Candidatus Kapabacteria bacterium]
MTIDPNESEFPTSRNSTIKGSRHLAREKVLQVLAATISDEISLDVAFNHVFYRQFTFDAKDAADETRILHPDEVHELEADVSIEWSNEDIEYARAVIYASRDQRETSTELIDRYSKNWDLERIALLDRVLMRLAIAELTTCPDIPIKVTINEAIELAKRYSTDKSGTFVNGILDAVIEELQKESRITKTGRGLVE